MFHYKLHKHHCWGSCLDNMWDICFCHFDHMWDSLMNIWNRPCYQDNNHLHIVGIHQDLCLNSSNMLIYKLLKQVDRQFLPKLYFKIKPISYKQEHLNITNKNPDKFYILNCLCRILLSMFGMKLHHLNKFNNLRFYIKYMFHLVLRTNHHYIYCKHLLMHSWRSLKDS